MNRQPVYLTCADMYRVTIIVCTLYKKCLFSVKLDGCEMVPSCPFPTKSWCTAQCCTDWVGISAAVCILPPKLLLLHKVTARLFSVLLYHTRMCKLMFFYWLNIYRCEWLFFSVPFCISMYTCMNIHQRMWQMCWWAFTHITPGCWS